MSSPISLGEPLALSLRLRPPSQEVPGEHCHGNGPQQVLWAIFLWAGVYSQGPGIKCLGGSNSTGLPLLTDTSTQVTPQTLFAGFCPPNTAIHLLSLKNPWKEASRLCWASLSYLITLAVERT